MPYLGQAKIVIDQATLPPGVAGVPRDDGVLAQVVTCRNADNTNITTNAGGWLWVLFKPRGSTATLSSPTSPTTTFTPDVDGTYRVELYVNQKQKPNQKARSAIAVRDVAGFRYPAQGESNENTWTSAYTLAPNETGWWEDTDKILRSGQAAISGSHLTVDPEPGLPNSRQIAFDPAAFTITDGGGGGTFGVALAIDPGTYLYADVGGSAENIVGARTVNTPTRDVTKYGQTNLGSESAGGYGTTANYASIGGGLNGLASGDYSHVGGGLTNTASANSAAVAGGQGNTASGGSSSVAGGSSNTASGSRAAVAGGLSNTASGDTSFVGGGSGNSATNDSATVAGGASNSCTGQYGFIGGGQTNSVGATQHSTIGGGSGNSCADDLCTIGGGRDNSAGAIYTAIAGGRDNAASGVASAVGGGLANAASGDYSTVVGGSNNTASGEYSTAAGRTSIASASDAHAVGYGAQAVHAGSIVLKDGAATTQASSTDNEITLRGDGGVRTISSGGSTTTRLGTSTSNYAQRKQGQQTTTDATLQQVNVAAIPTDQDCTITVSLKGKQASSANCKSLYYVATYTNNGGVVALTGSAHVNSTQATGLAAATVAVAVSGTNLQLQFQGIGATTIRWTYDVTYHFGGAT